MLEELEDHIYEAAILPEKWPRLLDELALVADAPGGVLMGFEARQPQNGKLVSSPAYHEFAQHYFLDGWGANNVRFATGVRNGSAFEPRFITEEDIFGDRPFADEALYRDFLIPNGLGRSVGTVFNHTHGDVVLLTFERPFEKGPIGATARSQLDGLRPELARATLISYRLAFERLRGATETLERLALPAAAVRSNGRVVISNGLFEASPAIRGSGAFDTLSLADERANRLLSEALERIAEPKTVRSIPLRRTDAGDVRQVLHVVPVRRDAHDVFVAAEAILVISSSGSAMPDRAPVLQTLFDLTHREAQVAAKLASGLTLQEVARSNGTSVETVRNQLRAIFAKTGCQRQGELAKLFAELFPSAGGGG